jgi:archaeal flagellar protein FlaJ
MIKNKKKISRRKEKSNFQVIFYTSLVIAAISFLVSRNLLISAISLTLSIGLINFYIYINKKLKKSSDIKKMEDIFPDFIELVGSNLRAGMTIDKALLLSSRKEFSPLDKEILKLGKDILTGKEITLALEEMSQRIESNKIEKTMSLIISGIRSGGDIAILLEETATSLREREFVEKKAASNVLMYVIFIFFAVAVGAPALFALSTIMVQVLHTILSEVPPIDANELGASMQMPFTLTGISISPSFVIYFAMAFIILIDILASLVLGLVNKGEEKEGLKYTLPLIGVSFIVFFLIRSALIKYFSEIGIG